LTSESPEGLVKTHSWTPPPQVSHSADLGRGLFNKFPGEGEVNPTENHCLRVFKNGATHYLSSSLHGRWCRLIKDGHALLKDKLKDKKALVLELHIMTEHGKQRLKYEEAELLEILA